MKIIDTIDQARLALLTGGLKAIERVLGSGPTVGRALPTAPTRPDPVILIGGYANFDESFLTWMRSLTRDGIPSFIVTVPDHCTGDLDAAAKFIAGEVAKIQQQTGTNRVDLVGFSAGGIVARQYAKFYAARDTIDAVVTLGTPNNGIGIGGVLGAVSGALLDPMYRVLLGKSAPQMRRGSDFLNRLNDASLGDSSGPSTRYGSVYSAIFDGAVTAAAARLERGTNIPIGAEPNLVKIPMGPDHYTILHRSSGVYEAARAVLLNLPAS